MTSRRLIDYLPIALTGGTAATRSVGRYKADNDWWERFLDDVIWKHKAACEEAGFTYRPLFWVIGGHDGDAILDFDAIVEAKKRGMYWLVGSPFVKAMNKLVDAGAEPIAYLGSPAHDPDFTAPVTTPAEAKARLDRIHDSLAPLWDAGIRSLGIDLVNGQERTTFAYALFVILRNWCRQMGGQCFAEPAPPPWAADWFGEDIVIGNDHWERQQAAGFIATPDQLTGEVVRIHDQMHGSNLPTVLGILRDGHTACTGVWNFLRDGVPLTVLH